MMVCSYFNNRRVMKHNLKFIRAEEEDVEYIFLKARLYFEHYNVLLDEDEVHEELMKIYKRLRADHSYTYKVIYRNEIVGCYTLRRVDDYMLLEDMYIDRRYRKIGFGARVLRRCMSDCVLPIKAEVQRLNFCMLSLLVNNGFEVEQFNGNESIIFVNANDKDFERDHYPIKPNRDFMEVIGEAHKRLHPHKKKAGRKPTKMSPFEKKYSVIGDVYSTGRKRKTPLVSKSVFGEYDQQLTGLQRLYYTASFPYNKKTKKSSQFIRFVDKNE